MKSNHVFRRSIAPLLIGTFIYRTNSGATVIVLGLLLARTASHHTVHAVTSLQVGLLPVAFYVAELTLSPGFGALGDRWGRRRFLIAGPLVSFIQVSLFAFTPMNDPLPYLLALQILSGLSGAMITPNVLGYLADFTVHSRAYRMRIMSFYELVTSGGIAVGTVLGGLAWQHLERRAFIVLGASYLLVGLCMVLAPVVNQLVEYGRLRATITRYWRVLRTPRLYIFIPAWVCINALVGIWLSSQLTFVLSTPSHSHPHQLLMGIFSGPYAGRYISLVLGVLVLVFGLCLLFWAFFLGRLSRLRLMLNSIAGIYLACVALAGINHLGFQDSWLLLIWLPMLLLGIFAETGFAPAALAYLADISESSTKDRGLVMGLYSIFLGVGQILGNGLGGLFAHQYGFDGLIYLTALLGFVAFISLLWLFAYERNHGSINAQDTTHI
jgi:MFS family permease